MESGDMLTRIFTILTFKLGVGARTLTVPNFGNSAVFVQVVSGVMTQNSLRGVGVESKSSFVINPWFKSGFRVWGAHGLSPWFL